MVGRDRRIPFVPTPKDVVNLMLRLADPSEGELLVDLGSGDGRILMSASLNYGARTLGIEKDPKLVEYSTKKARDLGIKGVKVVRADMFSYDFSKADVVTAYLTTSSLRLLEPKLRSLKPGARIVCHDFKIPGWVPLEVEEKISAHDSRLHRVYLYRVPESFAKRF